MKLPLVCYCLQIAGREFLIKVTHDGFIHWDDYQERRRLRHPTERSLEIKAIFGSPKARQRLNAEIDEFTVSFRLSTEMSARFAEAARLFDSKQWTDANERQLDEHLVPLFWENVNAYIVNPINAP